MTQAPIVSAEVLDRFALNYDQEWTDTPSGTMQRQAVWRRLEPLVHPGDNVLDLGCGTGADALHLMKKRATVTAIDGSPDMVRVARAKGVDARVMFIEHAASLRDSFHLVFSNFGALNCLPDLSALREPFSQLVLPRGHLAVCLMSRHCLWEFAYYATQGQFQKCRRRWAGAATSSIGVNVYYPNTRQVCEAFAPVFRLAGVFGIGITVPPSYVRGLSASTVGTLAAVDKVLEKTPLSHLADHRLFVFSRS